MDLLNNALGIHEKALRVRNDRMELLARNDELRVTANLRASRQLRGRTLGVQIIAGLPAVGDEVTFSTLP